MDTPTRSLWRSLLSPATLVSVLALCVAISSTAYAAVLITGKQIKNDTVTSVDIKNKTLKTKDLSARAVSDLRGQTGPQGATGPQGPAGPSNAYVARRTAGAGAQPASSTIVYKRINLPAGSYTITSHFGLDDISGSPRTVDCELVNGTTVLSQTYVTLPGSTGGWSCVNMAGVTLAAPGTITLQFTTPPASIVRLGTGAIVATKVADLTLTASPGAD